VPYIITNNSGDEVIIPDGGLNNDYSIQLVGRNYENYGAIIAKTQLSLLENFATDSTPPTNPTDGQLWYDKSNRVLRVYDSGGGSWLNQTPLVVSSAPSNNYNQIVNGFMYFDTDLGQLYLYANGSYYRANSPGTVSGNFSSSTEIGSPTEYGTNVRTIFLYDTDGVPRSVYAVVNISNGSGQPNLGSYFQNEQLIAIFSTHDEFTVADSPAAIVEGTTHVYTNQLAETGGIGLVIKPGVNTRTDATAPVNYAKIAERANAAYALNTGSGTINSDGTVNDNGGATIPATDVFHAGADSIPNISVTYDLGEPTTVFAEGYIKDLYIGEQGSTGSIQPNGDSVVNIGLELNPIDFIYVDEITVAGNINLPNGGDLGDPGAPIDNIYANNITVYETLTVDGYQLPTAAGNMGDQIFLGAGGDSHWYAPYNTYTSIDSPNSSVDVELDPIVSTTVGTFEPTPIAVRLRSNVEFIHNQFTGSTYIAYNDAGKFTLNYPNPFKDNSDSSAGWDFKPADFVKVADVDQDVAGVKTFTGTLTIDSGADLKFDTTYTIDINSSSLRFRSAGGAGKVEFSDFGDVTATGDITAFSDSRLKENIEPISNALDKISQLSGYTFNKKDTGKRSTGVIAQEVEKVLPEAVQQDSDGMLSVAYGNMVGLLIEAVKELQQEVNDLKEQLNKQG
jgi:hypothetical protein